LLLLAGLGFLLGFARLQASREHPLVPLSLFTREETAVAYVCGALLGTTIFGVDTFVPLFVQGARGGTAAAAGAVVTPVMFFWALSASVAARLVVPLGFKRTARAGASLVVAGFAGLLACAGRDADVPWISAACALVGCGLGLVSLTQVLVIQHTTPERVRGVATSLVPFFRALGGALGVGALGGLLSVGLVNRLGPAAETAGRLLSGRTLPAPVSPADGQLDPERLRVALEQALFPVFAVLLGLAIVNLYVTGRFPGRADEEPAAGGAA
jgi:MFS family permease